MIQQQGYVKFFRQIIDWEWYTDIPVRILFEHCLLKANYQDKNWRGITIKKGSFVTSYENLAIETGLTSQQVRTAINKLKSTGEITYQSTSQYSIITVNKWDEFQEDNNQNNNQITNEQQTNNKQITTTKEIKEIEEIEERKEEKENEETKKGFDLFFESYPKQEDEYKTYTLYSSIINGKIATQDELLKGAIKYRKYTAGSDPKFIKAPCNWLKDMSWKNDYKIKEEKDDGECCYDHPKYEKFSVYDTI